ncbi:MAG: nuclear transport factor 2 family protein [Bacteroidetes bacterium]|nr:nuclear transport factor 2 family protein [Bacteroidota bacterium]
MKKLLILIAVIAFYNTAFCQNDETANVLALERNIADAFTKHNAPAIITTFSDDATIILANGEMAGKQQLLQYLPNITSVVLSDMKVVLKGGIAIVTGIQVENGKNDAGVYSNKYRFMDVLEKTKGQWKIIASQATFMEQ